MLWKVDGVKRLPRSAVYMGQGLLAGCLWMAGIQLMVGRLSLGDEWVLLVMLAELGGFFMAFVWGLVKGMKHIMEWERF